MDLETTILSEVSQKEKDKYRMISLNMWNLKYDTDDLFTKRKQTHRHRKQAYSYQKGKGWERDRLGVWD